MWAVACLRGLVRYVSARLAGSACGVCVVCDARGTVRKEERILHVWKSHVTEHTQHTVTQQHAKTTDPVAHCALAGGRCCCWLLLVSSLGSGAWGVALAVTHDPEPDPAPARRFFFLFFLSEGSARAPQSAQVHVRVYKSKGCDKS